MMFRVRLTVLTACLCVCVAAGRDAVSGIPQQPSGSEPASVMLLIDTSSSTFHRGNEERAAFSSSLAHLIEAGNQQNEYSIIVVSTDAKLVLDRATDTKVAVDKAKKLIDERTSGATALYDAYYLAVKKMEQSRYQRRLILIISDGIDTSSSKTIDSLNKVMAELRVPTYSIAIRDSENNRQLSNRGERFLDEIARVSGGKSFKPKKPEEIRNAFERIGNDLNK